MGKHVELPSLSDLLVFLNDDVPFVLFDDFVSLLRAKPSQSDKPIQRSNMLKEFRNHFQGNSLQHIDGKQCVKFSSILRYAYHYCEDFAICQNICQEIESKLLKKASLPYAAPGVYDLYKEI